MPFLRRGRGPGTRSDGDLLGSSSSLEALAGLARAHGQAEWQARRRGERQSMAL
jgi:hypothetical protein